MTGMVPNGENRNWVRLQVQPAECPIYGSVSGWHVQKWPRT